MTGWGGLRALGAERREEKIWCCHCACLAHHGSTLHYRKP